MAGRKPELVVAAVTGRAHAGESLCAAAGRRGCPPWYRRPEIPQPACASPRRAPGSLPLSSRSGRHHGGRPRRVRTPAASPAPARRRRPAATTRPGLSSLPPPSRGIAPVQGAPATPPALQAAIAGQMPAPEPRMPPPLPATAPARSQSAAAAARHAGAGQRRTGASFRSRQARAGQPPRPAPSLGGWQGIPSAIARGKRLAPARRTGQSGD
jgi:hypothetical protein